MTQPPDPRDPFGSSTRRFDPEQPTSAYQPDAYPGTEQYGTGQYGTAQYGTEQYGQGHDGGSGGSGRRTRVLIGSIIAALLAILLVAFLISVSGGKGGDNPAPLPSESTSSPTSEETTSSETTTTESSPTSETTAPTAAGQVVYRLVGDGDLIVVRYSADSETMTLATVRSPWSVTASVPDGQASLGAIVVRGSVTCQIVAGGAVVAEGTSSGGPLNCAADVAE